MQYIYCIGKLIIIWGVNYETKKQRKEKISLVMAKEGLAIVCNVSYSNHMVFGILL